MLGVTGDVLAGKRMTIRQDIPVLLLTGYSNRISPEKAAEKDLKAFG